MKRVNFSHSKVSKITLAAGLAVSLGVGMAEQAAAKELLYLADDVPAGLDYDGPTSSLPTTQTGILNLMDPLFGYPKTGIIEGGVERLDFKNVEGRLVESWSFDEASLTWTFNLRKGVKSCAGNELTTADVLYTFQRAKAVSGAGATGWFLNNVASVDGFTAEVFTDPTKRELGDAVVAVDDYTFTLRQSEHNALLLPVLTIIGTLIFDSKVMKEMATEKDPWSYDYANTVNAPGFGPYCLGGWTKNQEMIFDANPDYYRGAPDISKVIMRRVPQSSNRVVILRTGQAQLVQGLTPREYDSLRQAPGVQVFSIKANHGLSLPMNFKVAPFDNPKLRQAIAYAIPYQQIIDSAFFGQAEKWNGVVPSTYPDAIEPSTQFSYDPEKAKALLAEAGFPEGKGLEAYASALTLSYVSERESILGPVANMIQSSLRNIGIPVTLDPIPQSQMGDRSLIKRDLPMFIDDHDRPIGVDSGYAAALFFVSVDKGGVVNVTNYSNDFVDDTWAKARIETDPATRSQLLVDLQEQVMKDVFWAPIAELKSQWAGSAKLSGLTYESEGALRFFDLKLAD